MRQIYSCNIDHALAHTTIMLHYHFLALIPTFTPTRFLKNPSLVSSSPSHSISNSKFRNTAAIMHFSFMSARFLPIHARGPTPKGMKAAACCGVRCAGSQRSGTNACASGPHISFERWMVYVGTERTSPGWNVYPQRDIGGLPWGIWRGRPMDEGLWRRRVSLITHCRLYTLAKKDKQNRDESAR